MHRSNHVTACSLTILFTAALIPAFAQSSKIVQSEIRLEPSPLLPPFHDQFGLVVGVSANGNTLAINAATEDNGPISEVGAILIFDRISNQWIQTARLFPNDGVDDEQLGTLGTSLSELKRRIGNRGKAGSRSWQ